MAVLDTILDIRTEPVKILCIVDATVTDLLPEPEPEQHWTLKTCWNLRNFHKECGLINDAVYLWKKSL